MTRRAALVTTAAITLAVGGFAQPFGVAAVLGSTGHVTQSARAASRGPSGAYRATIYKPASLKGTYQIEFSPGHFTVRAPYGIVGHGTDSISGSKMTVHGPSASCRAAGSYEFRMTSSSLSFKKLHDVCPRAAVLTGGNWKKV